MRKTIILLLSAIALFSGCSSTTTDSDLYGTAEVASTTAEAVREVTTEAEVEVEEPEIIYEPQLVPETIKEDAVIAYQIFPIAFADSDGNGTGDLKGITEHLDYIKNEMNADVLWLNPIHPSPTYHKYDVTDYYEIDPSLGTMEDYEELLAEAEKREIRVLMDFVINHSSAKHPWFVNSRSSLDSDYRDWYVWNTLEEGFSTKQGWYKDSTTNEYYFASFWDQMPEFNFDNPEVREEMKAIAKFWLDKGVDGFRIDAAKHVYDIKEYPKGTKVFNEGQEWFLEFNHYIKEVNPEAFLILETWDSASTVGLFLEGADASFNFDMAEAIISSVNLENRKNVQDKLPKIYNSYDKVATDYIDAIFLTNHDKDRVMSQLGNNKDKAKLAAVISHTLPGITWIYYGEELGMTGVGDHMNIREGFKWSDDPQSLPNSRWRTWNYAKDLDSLETQMNDEASMFNHYRELTALKSGDDVLAYGAYKDYEIGTSFRVFSFFRVHEGKTYLVMHNLHEASKTFTLSDEVAATVYSTQGSVAEGMELKLEPYGSLVLEVSSTEVTAEEIK